MQKGTLRRTKIVSTLGPATDSAEMIGRLVDAGVNVFRINMSHAPHDWVRRVVKDIRAAAAARMSLTTRRTQSWGAWDMLSRKTLTPASTSLPIISAESVAGPRVDTILVRRRVPLCMKSS